MTKKEQITELIKEDSWHNIPVENTTDKIFSILCVSNRRELLLAFCENLSKMDITNIEDKKYHGLVDRFLSK